jgi:hypothetical protein
MSVPLRPQQEFTVVRQIANHLDTDTNYVRAVIRNAYTDDILATLNLTDKGGQRFTGNWRVAPDPSGQGFYVSIGTSVYTDSGYTTKNSNYGDEENTHLVSNNFGAAATGGGGGIARGAGTLDAYTIRRIVKEELEKAKPEPVDIPAMPTMRFDEVLEAIQAVKSGLSRLPTETADTGPILAALKSLEAAVEAKPVTPATDLSPVLSALKTLTPELQNGMRNLITLLDDAQGRFSEEAVKEIERLFKETEFTIAPSTAKLAPPKAEQPREAVPTNLEDFAA